MKNSNDSTSISKTIQVTTNHKMQFFTLVLALKCIFICNFCSFSCFELENFLRSRVATTWNSENKKSNLKWRTLGRRFVSLIVRISCGLAACLCGVSIFSLCESGGFIQSSPTVQKYDLPVDVNWWLRIACGCMCDYFSVTCPGFPPLLTVSWDQLQHIKLDKAVQKMV